MAEQLPGDSFAGTRRYVPQLGEPDRVGHRTVRLFRSLEDGACHCAFQMGGAVMVNDQRAGFAR